ncbi:MAG TPA: glycosyltransferase family 2 protein [Acidobacteriota bacterium]|nr:glycosyltransferase family 2 protein [Acidobacteriota bacterium]
MSSLGIVIVNYNSTDYLQKCLQSIFAQTSTSPVHTVVVDNASDDQDFAGLEKAFPDTHFILNEENYGFSTACNQGIRYQAADFYLLLNPDCVIEDSAIDRTLNFLIQHPEVGIAGCRVNNPDGTLQLACRRRIPRPSVALGKLFGLAKIFPRSQRFAAYNYGDLDQNVAHEVEAVSGSFLMFRHEVLAAIGDLDESFFLYGEDLDFCFRAAQAGWKVYYYPGAAITHFKRVSSTRSPKASNYHFHNAMEIFYRKHFSADSGPIERFTVLRGIRLKYWWSRLRLAVSVEPQVGSDR